jgi:hypothetical protein
MSLLFYVVFILGVTLGGLVVLVLFSLLAMARKGEESMDRLKLEMLRTHACTSPLKKKPKPDDLSAPPSVDLYHGDAPQTRVCNRR